MNFLNPLRRVFSCPGQDALRLALLPRKEQALDLPELPSAEAINPHQLLGVHCPQLLDSRDPAARQRLNRGWG